VSRSHMQVRSPERGVWPIDTMRYDRSPLLTPLEQEALNRLLAEWGDQERYTVPKALACQLVRLLQPLYDIQDALGVQRRSCSIVWSAMCRGMCEHRTAYWVWSQHEWSALLTSLFLRYPRGYASATANRQPRYQLLAIAYCLGPPSDFWLPFLKEISPLACARLLFGEELLNTAITRIVEVLGTWGYQAGTAGAHMLLRTTVVEVFLANHSAHLEHVTLALLDSLREKLTPQPKRAVLERVSKALAQLGIIEAPLRSSQEMRKLLPEHRNTDGVHPEWVQWCLQWYRFSDLTPQIKWRYVGKLFQTGRWLKQEHPEVTCPQQWTSLLAAEYVAAVDQMKVGDFGIPEYCAKLSGKGGAPLTAATKDQQLAIMRAFFRDMQEPPHDVPRRFDPVRAFGTPRTICNQLGPNPRDLDPLLWAKLVHAALNLTEADLPRTKYGALHYPLAFVRAVAVVWVYSGLRSDEIRRLRLGCIRWQREDVTIPETGAVLPKEATCFLTVPTNKTTASFQKPVNPIVGHRINEWEWVRASGQPARGDRKTGSKMEYLFAHRGKSLGKEYLNARLIPLLCERAGIPRADERGAITSHRARATLATLLYNAPEGLSIFELMQWLGHKDPGTTQHYARVKPTRLAAAYSQAERNSRLVETLVDTKTDVTGKVNIYYVLGEHGLCGNPDWSSCLYRMACMKCPYFIPKDQTRLIEASRTVKRFMEVVELTEEELAAVQDDYGKLEAAVERSQHAATPTMLRRRAKGANGRGIPLTVLNTPPGPGEKHHLAYMEDWEKNSERTKRFL
jgi:integrase